MSETSEALNVISMFNKAIEDNPAAILAAILAASLALLSVGLTLVFYFRNRDYEKDKLLIDLMSTYLDLAREGVHGAARRILLHADPDQLGFIHRERQAVLPVILRADVATLLGKAPAELSATETHVVLSADQSTLIRDRLFHVVNTFEAVSAPYRFGIVNRKHFLDEFRNVFFREEVSVFDKFINFTEYYPSIKRVRDDILQKHLKARR